MLGLWGTKQLRGYAIEKTAGFEEMDSQAAWAHKPDLLSGQIHCLFACSGDATAFLGDAKRRHARAMPLRLYETKSMMPLSSCLNNTNRPPLLTSHL